MDEKESASMVLIPILLTALIAGYYFVKWTQEYFNKKAHRIEVVNHEAASLQNASTELSSILSISSATFPGTSLDVLLVNIYE